MESGDDKRTKELSVGVEKVPEQQTENAPGEAIIESPWGFCESVFGNTRRLQEKENTLSQDGQDGNPRLAGQSDLACDKDKTIVCVKRKRSDDDGEESGRSQLTDIKQIENQAEEIEGLNMDVPFLISEVADWLQKIGKTMVTSITMAQDLLKSIVDHLDKLKKLKLRIPENKKQVLRLLFLMVKFIKNVADPVPEQILRLLKDLLVIVEQVKDNALTGLEDEKEILERFFNQLHLIVSNEIVTPQQVLSYLRDISMIVKQIGKGEIAITDLVKNIPQKIESNLQNIGNTSTDFVSYIENALGEIQGWCKNLSHFKSCIKTRQVRVELVLIEGIIFVLSKTIVTIQGNFPDEANDDDQMLLRVQEGTKPQETSALQDQEAGITPHTKETSMPYGQENPFLGLLLPNKRQKKAENIKPIETSVQKPFEEIEDKELDADVAAPEAEDK
ncbi:uncharacterized protein LOC143039215 [Oratosquilla oratoria]|uniref:uncharacterized protein LOC143039215 n=1 Tax=Oratosquilla oratoria TaxID=337810 RepID=UPI003F763C68